jgi:aminoglycoside phosphotransferase (APT) family kinase protein
VSPRRAAGGSGPGSSEDRAVRAEDAFDVAAVDAWVREANDDGNGGWRTPLPPGAPEVRQFAGGASNLTYLLRYGDRDLILRRPPAGTKPSSAHDMAREYRIQASLKPVFAYVPRMLALCTDHAVLGSDFYVMERVEGMIPRRTMPPQIGTDPVLMRALSERFVDLLVELHSVDVAAAGLSDLGRGAGYVERQLNGWTQRYTRAKTWNVPSFKRVISWLHERRPDDVRICLIHNDFRLDNMVLDAANPLNVRAVLDWELATLGDPLMDLGSSLAYWIEPGDGRAAHNFRRQPSHLPGMLTRREIVERYCAATGLDPGDWPFYEVFGMFRLAGIVQQIYYRYHHGQTSNPAFRRFWLAAHMLERRCSRTMRAAR